MSQPHVYQRVIDLAPEMELVIRARDGSACDRADVREQLTLGRAAASDLVIDDPRVNLIHARVVPAAGGGWELRGVGMSRMILGDGSGVDRLELRPGVRFEVGGTRVECVLAEHVKRQKAKVKSEDGDAGVLTSVSMSPGSHVEGAPKIEMPRLVACPTCYRDMKDVAVVARFCPTCGSQLPPRNAEGYLIPPEESSPLYPVYRALRDELEAKLTDESPQAASSLIILAYANALLNLGWRYEHGRGILRNVEEAARCYAKAGRLSEVWDKSKG
jgi:hypothetical protein